MRSMRWGGLGGSTLLLLFLWVDCGVADAQQVQRRTTSPDSISSGPTLETVSTTLEQDMLVAWWGQHGGKVHLSTDLERPAVLLVHGLNQTAEKSWIQPSKSMLWEAAGIPSALNWREHPEPRIQRRGDYHDGPNVGIFKIGTSDRIENVDQYSWFDFLSELDLTVAAWTQPGAKIADAYPSALEAYRNLAELTQGPIVLLGHSRGGLIIRKLLKEGGDMTRVGMVITLNSPHHGSEMANGWA